jgi:cysteine-S-conjugate beta-lyase
MVFPNLAATFDATWQKPYTYGLYGTPTTLDLAQRLAAMTGGSHTFVVPSGQAAIALVNLAFLRPGDHVLLPDSLYGTHRDLILNHLAQFQVEPTFYNPLGTLSAHLRPNTRLVWFESPGSITMEVQNIPALLEELRGTGILTAIDDTYSAGVLYRPFDHGIDISIQAISKYIGGHSDLLLGCVTTAPHTDKALYVKLGDTHRILGLSASPDDCTLALRGLQTLGVRLAAAAESALTLARALENLPSVAAVLHPSLPSCPGHEHFLRDFTGPAALFSFVFHERISQEQTEAFVDALRLFKIGYSWGGTTSVVMAYPHDARILAQHGPRLVRFGVGLEFTSDLLADIHQALAAAKIS